MRELTMNEKVIVKDALEARGICLFLADINTRSALYWWNIASSTPLSSLLDVDKA